ncbi:MAG: hypothetical protein KAS30_04755 [Candidatus Diapherotrites archaeon]|nr:hypothetical protein [Candidatus Diapherotrites archaeon]
MTLLSRLQLLSNDEKAQISLETMLVASALVACAVAIITLMRTSMGKGENELSKGITSALKETKKIK